jgi:hypothetical protein
MPAVALCGVTVLLAGVVDPAKAAVAVIGAWLVVTAPAWRGQRYATGAEWLERSVAFRGGGQVAIAAVAAVSVVIILAAHRDPRRKS